ncbi:MAG TPA: phosphatase PAP2 family protein [Mycobacteriales bacterium]|nr:phosphatase PAP2 family protein [Mycobacteriales bacterium]
MTARPRGAPGGSPRLLLAALVVYVLITVDVLAGGPLTHLDHAVSEWARSTGIPGKGWKRPWQFKADQMVNFGDREVVGVIVLIAVGWICLRARTIMPLVRIAVLAAAAAAVVLAFKYGIGRTAPSGVHGPEMFRSYPSGHTATSVILWGGLYAVVADYPQYAVSRSVAWLLSWLGPLMVMVGMVLRDYHWATDLVAAVALCTVLLQTERLALGHWRRARRGPAADRAGGALSSVGAGPGAG